MPEGPGPPPYERTGAVRNSRVQYIPLAFSIVALAMVCALLAVPWYSYTLHDGPNYAGVEFTSYRDYSLFGIYHYDGEEDSASFTGWSYRNYEASGPGLYTYVLYLVIIGVALAVSTVGACLLALRKGRRDIAVASAVALVAWCIFMPLFFMISYPDGSDGTNISDFWRTEHIHDHESGAPDGIHHIIMTWGPGTGWYLSFVAGITGALCAVGLAFAGPRPIFARAWRPAAVAVMAVLCLMSSAAALYPEPPPPGEGLITNIGCTAEALPGGDWLINVTSGNKDAGGVSIQVIDPATGKAILSAKISSGTASNPDFTWTDWSGNNKLDAGDSILLRGTVNGQPNPKIQEGFKVLFMKNNDIIGTIKELPPH